MCLFFCRAIVKTRSRRTPWPREGHPHPGSPSQTSIITYMHASSTAALLASTDDFHISQHTRSRPIARTRTTSSESNVHRVAEPRREARDIIMPIHGQRGQVVTHMAHRCYLCFSTLTLHLCSSPGGYLRAAPAKVRKRQHRSHRRCHTKHGAGCGFRKRRGQAARQ